MRIIHKKAVSHNDVSKAIRPVVLSSPRANRQRRQRIPSGSNNRLDVKEGQSRGKSSQLPRQDHTRIYKCAPSRVLRSSHKITTHNLEEESEPVENRLRGLMIDADMETESIVDSVVTYQRSDTGMETEGTYVFGYDY